MLVWGQGVATGVGRTYYVGRHGTDEWFCRQYSGSTLLKGTFADDEDGAKKQCQDWESANIKGKS